MPGKREGTLHPGGTSERSDLNSIQSHLITSGNFGCVSRPGLLLPEHELIALMATVGSTNDPAMLQEALLSKDAVMWKEAADAEYNSLIKNKTWELQPLPPGRKAITNRWLFCRKYNADGTVSRFKARLVVRGFSQVAGQDYYETFTPVIRFPTIHIVLALIAFL